MLLGRVTYEGFATASSQRTGDDRAADENAISPRESQVESPLAERRAQGFSVDGTPICSTSSQLAKMPLDSMITHANASVANTQPCSTSISERPPTPARRNPKMFPAARKTVAPGCGCRKMRYRIVRTERRTPPGLPPTPTATDATEVKGLGVRTASPMNITLTKHHSALAARKRSSGVRSIW